MVQEKTTEDSSRTATDSTYNVGLKMLPGIKRDIDHFKNHEIPDIKKAKKDLEDLKSDIERAEKSLGELKTIMWVVVVAVVAAFIVGFYVIAIDNISGKKIFYDHDLKTDALKEKINQQQIQINNLENVLKNLKINYPWLKIPEF